MDAKDKEYFLNNNILNKSRIFTTNVAGITYIPKYKETMLYLLNYNQNGYKIPIILKREKDNKYDSNAIMVCTRIKNKDLKLGYIPKKWNEILVYVLDNKDKYKVLTSSAKITGGVDGKENFGIVFDYKIVKLS